MHDLGQLRSFLEVVERGTIAAAAAALEYTPPAVSQQIAKLERALDVALFDRVGGRLSLTAAGQALVPVARQMLDLAERGRAVVHEEPQHRRFIVAGLASALATIVAPRLRTLDPSMSVYLLEAEDDTALRELSTGHVDVVLTQEYTGIPIDRHRRFAYEPVATDGLRLVLPPRFSPDATTADLGDLPWLLNGTGTRCEAATRRILDDTGVTPTFCGDIADNQALLALVHAGHGATIVPESMLRASATQVTVASQRFAIERTILAVTRHAAAARTRSLLDHLAA